MIEPLRKIVEQAAALEEQSGSKYEGIVITDALLAGRTARDRGRHGRAGPADLRGR